MTPGESVDSAEVPVASENGALCIIRNMTTGQAHSSTGEGMAKVTMMLPVTTTAAELMDAVGRHFQYAPDSFELLLQRVTDGDCVSVHTCGDKTIQEIGFHTDGTTRNVLVIYDRDREPPKRLMGPEPEEGSCSTSAAADWVRNTRGAAGESKCYPAETKDAIGYVGLVNQAMTCYLNSLLQTLYMTPEFRNALYRWEFDGTEQDAAKSIPFQLQKLFLLLQTSSKPAIGTTDLTTSFGWDSSEAWQQHDVQELCRVMFDALEHKFKHTDQAKLICQLYEGKLKDYVKCLECGSESAREDTFMDIPLVVRPFGSNQAYGSVEEALRAFVTPETLDGCNQYSCERCGRKCDAHKGLKFVRFPYLLTLQLKRFDFDPATMHRIKLNDKVTFPEILDLNQFVRLESENESPSDDADTTDSGSALDDEAAVTSTSSGPSSSRQANGPCEDMGSDDEGIDVGSGSGSNADAVANARNLKRNVNMGPYMYELFSIMVHSGSASGGHYYAYIKSFTENQWYCFNDAQVTRVTYDEIRKTYGGGPSRGGYYISSYASSTNAYMLMYRRVDKEQNAVPMMPDQFPEHLKVLLENMQEAEERERQQKELDRSMCKIKLFCLHPRKHTMQDMRLKVHKDASLAEATQTAHQIMNLVDVVPLDCCRLVMYDDCSDSLECSLEEVAHQTMGQILGGVKSTYPFDLLLEIRKPHETFQPYKIGGTTVKVHVVNIQADEISRAVIVRGLKTQTVEEFKAQVAQKLGLPSSNMRMVLENYHNALELLNAPGRMLKSEGFGKSNTVFIEFLSEEDAKLPFRESRFFEILDRHINTIVIYVQLPLEEEVSLEKQRVSASAENDERCGSVEDEGGTATAKPTQPIQTANTALSDGYDSDLCDSSSSGCRGGDHSEDSSLTDSERTLVGDDMSPRNNSPDIADAYDGGEEQQPKLVPSVEMTDQIKRSMLEPSGSTSVATPAPATSAADGVSEEATDFACGDAAPSQVEVAPTKEEPRRYFRAWPYTDKEDGSRKLRVYIDKRITFGALKKELEPYIGIDSSHFKVFRVYSNNQEFECTKLTDNLASYAEDTKFVIKLGRALKPGEHRMDIYLLSPNDPEPSKFLLDWIFTQGTTVLQIKQEILHKVRERCGQDIPLNRCRLRKKISGNPGAVFLDSDRLDSDASMFLSHKVFLELLSEPEKVVSANSLVLFVRRWRPSTFTFDPLEEVILNERTFGALKDELSKLSGLDPSVIEVAKCPGQFPCLVSSLTVHTEMDWQHNAPSLTAWPLYIGEDGLVVLYRDRTEELKELTEEEKQEISSRENVRAAKNAKAVPSPRKERALKIYMGSPPNDSGALSSDTKPSLNSVPIDLD